MVPSAVDVNLVSLAKRTREQLSAYKIPKRFAAVPRSDIPVLSSGKVDLVINSTVADNSTTNFYATATNAGGALDHFTRGQGIGQHVLDPGSRFAGC